MLRASFEDVIGRAAEHTSLKAKGTGSPKFSNGINRVLPSISWLAALHRLLSRGYEGAIRGRSGARGLERKNSSGSSGARGSRGSDGNRSCERCRVPLLELAKDGLGDEVFRVTEDGKIADSGNTEGPESVELRGAGGKGRQIRRRTQRVILERLLQIVG